MICSVWEQPNLIYTPNYVSTKLLYGEQQQYIYVFVCALVVLSAGQKLISLPCIVEVIRVGGWWGGMLAKWKLSVTPPSLVRIEMFVL